MPDAPNRRLMRNLSETSVAFLWVIGLQIEDMELRFKSGCNELVHADVLAVELHPAYTIAYVGVPSKAVGLQVE